MPSAFSPSKWKVFKCDIPDTALWLDNTELAAALTQWEGTLRNKVTLPFREMLAWSKGTGSVVSLLCSNSERDTSSA